ncbi:MAG: hypothetical protein JWQ88_1956 [Rhodoferax sp.]|nr:hypothetical protein [Rhodoferax sp.]
MRTGTRKGTRVGTGKPTRASSISAMVGAADAGLALAGTRVRICMITRQLPPFGKRCTVVRHRPWAPL